MTPHLVKPCVKTPKNDAVAADAIPDTVSRPNMRLVPIKSTESHALLAAHRARQAFVKAHSA